MVFEDELDVPAQLKNMDLVFVDNFEVPRYIFFMALIFMSKDVTREDDSSPVNHPEKVRTWLRFIRWNCVRTFL